MQLIDKTIRVANNAGEEGEHIRLIVGDQQNAVFRLSLQQARSLATTLIQQVHRAEVRSSMRKPHREQNVSSLDSLWEPSGATVFVPASQQL